MTEPTRAIQETKDVLIPLPDGCELAANLILPVDSPPAPAIVVYQPYLKDLHGRGPILEWQRHFARRGYPTLVVDIRGTGASGGVVAPPNAASEKEDAIPMLAWIAGQPWCNGVTGMWGISYSGSTALAAASMRPPSLKALIPLHGTANEYWGFLRPHGCRPAWWTDASWGPRMVLFSLLPPLSRDPHQRWARIWRDRLAQLDAPLPFLWHTTPFARYMDWATDATQVEASLYAVSGWHDYYPQATFDYFNAASGPKRILIGEWKHEFPDLAERGGLDHRADMDRWWDRWLRGIDNGIDREPPVHVWHQGGERWRAEAAWPPAHSESHIWFVAPGKRLARSAADAGVSDTLRVDPTIGLDLLPWDPQAPVTPMPFDRAGDDHRALCYDTESLSCALDIIGQPRVVVDLVSDYSPFPLHVALCDVYPNGLSTLICQGWLDTVRGIAPPLRAGERREIAVPLYSTSYRIAAGHRLRLTISGADFPLLWPAPVNPTLTVFGGTRLELPVATLADSEAAVHLFGPQPARPDETTAAGRWENRVTRDLTGVMATFEQNDSSTLTLDDGTLLTIRQHNRSLVCRDRPADAHFTAKVEARLERDGGPIEVTVESIQTVDHFRIDGRIDIAGRPYFRRSWDLPVGN